MSFDDIPTLSLIAAVLFSLGIASVVGQFLRRQPEGTVNPALVQAFNQRLRAWWLMWAILALGLVLGRVVAVVLFGLVSFWALREFITMTPTRRGDHRALFWTLCLFTPAQYVLVGLGRSFVGTSEDSWFGFLGGIDFYGVYSIMIPVYASLAIPARVAVSGDPKRFLERTAKIQAGLLICVYSLSYAPALLDMELYRYADGGWVLWEGNNAGLLFYLVLVVQLGDVMQYVGDKVLGKHVIAPSVHASKTWEGFLGGALTTMLCGALLWWVTPFSFWGSACMSLVIAVMGFAGSMTMSAIKRDRGVADFGTLVQGHVGVLDRIDSICFAAPVFYHLTRLFHYAMTSPPGPLS